MSVRISEPGWRFFFSAAAAFKVQSEDLTFELTRVLGINVENSVVSHCALKIQNVDIISLQFKSSFQFKEIQ